MGNHSETAELLEEARELVLTEADIAVADSLVDEFGNAIRLDSPDETKRTNPSRLKDSSGRDVDFIISKEVDGLTLKQIERMKTKDKKKNS